MVALDGAQPVGFILSEYEGQRAHISTVDVLEPFRRRRVGSDLVRAQETWLAAQGVRCIELETATDNAPAIAFWEKHGYRTRGTVKNFQDDRKHGAFGLDAAVPSVGTIIYVKSQVHTSWSVM